MPHTKVLKTRPTFQSQTSGLKGQHLKKANQTSRQKAATPTTRQQAPEPVRSCPPAQEASVLAFTYRGEMPIFLGLLGMGMSPLQTQVPPSPFGGLDKKSSWLRTRRESPKEKQGKGPQAPRNQTFLSSSSAPQENQAKTGDKGPRHLTAHPPSQAPTEFLALINPKPWQLCTMNTQIRVTTVSRLVN